MRSLPRKNEILGETRCNIPECVSSGWRYSIISFFPWMGRSSNPKSMWNEAAPASASHGNIRVFGSRCLVMEKGRKMSMPGWGQGRDRIWNLRNYCRGTRRGWDKWRLGKELKGHWEWKGVRNRLVVIPLECDRRVWPEVLSSSMKKIPTPSSSWVRNGFRKKRREVVPLTHLVN